MFFFLLTVFVLIILSLLVFILAFLKLSSLPPKDSLPPDPNMVICSPDDVLEAYIRGYPNRETCPPFTNNYVIDNQFNMFEKNFRVDSTTDCCWFSNEENSRVRFPNPWICNGSNRVFSVSELNEKPYFFDGTTTYYLNPSCDDPNCISMIRIGLTPSLTPDLNDGVYKVTKFRTESTDIYDPSEVPPLDSSADYARRLNFIVGESCQTLNKIYFDDQLLMETNSQGQRIWYDTNPGLRPDIVKAVVEIFDRDRFYPIAGANPPLSAAASNFE